MMAKAVPYGEIAIGLAFAAGGAGIFTLAAGLRNMPGMSVGPGLFPKIIGGLMVVFGLLLALGAALKASRKRKDAAEEGPGAGTGGSLALSGYSLAVLAGLVVLTLALPSIGFLLGGMAFTILICRLGGASWAGSAVFGAVMTFALYYVFVHGLGVPLPRGLWGI